MLRFNKQNALINYLNTYIVSADGADIANASDGPQSRLFAQVGHVGARVTYHEKGKIESRS